MKNVKLLVILARHDTTVAPLSQPACQQAIMIGPNSLFGFWSTTTQRHFDFIGSTMLPVVDIQLGADVGRTAVAQLAISAARNLGGPDPVSGMNGILVIPFPGVRQIQNPDNSPGAPPTITQGLDGGATSVGGIGVAVVPVNSDFTFLSHEVGHVLGFGHTFGLLNNGTDWNGSADPVIEGYEYGSPYDLMSSATFGGRWEGPPPHYNASPTFALPAIAGWPGSRSAGPNVSRALLHYTEPGATTGSVLDRAYPAPGGRVLERIWAPDQDNMPRVLVLHPPNEPANGVGRVYVEFRAARGWDAGLGLTGPQLDRVGTVVHTVTDVPNVGPRVWYRGSVPTGSIDRDVVVDTTGLVVRVANDDPSGASALVEVTVGARAWVDIAQSDYAVHDNGVERPTETRRTPCLDVITVHSFNTVTRSSFTATATGVGSDGAPGTKVALAWAVDGAPLNPGSGQSVVPGSNGQLIYSLTNDVLTLTSTAGQKVRADVQATVTDGVTTASAHAMFAADGIREWLSNEDSEKVRACKRKFSRWVRIRVPWLRVPIPDPPPLDTLTTPALELENWQRAALVQFENLPGLTKTDEVALGQLLELQRLAAQPPIVG